MAKKTIMLLSLLLLTYLSKGQELNYFSADKLTYEKYLAEDWKGLTKIGHQALKADIDFYYLQVRMGIAYFERGKYLLASPYFERALKENKEDPFLEKSLYYSYLNSGFENMSLTVYEQMNKKTKNDIKLSSQKLKSLSISLGISPNNEYSQLLNYNYYEDDGIIAYTYIDKNLTDFNLDLNLQLNKKLFLYQSFSFSKDNYSLVKQSTIHSDFQTQLSTTQLRYYGKLSYYFGDRWNLSANYNLLVGIIEDVDKYVITDPSRIRRIFIYRVPYAQSSVGLSLKKQWYLFDFKPHIDIFNSYEQTNLYMGFDFSFYPLGNNNLHFKTASSYDILSENSLPLVISQEIGFRIWKFNLYGTYYYGEINNFLENDGYFLFNTPEILTNMFSGGISFLTKDKTYFFSISQSDYAYKYTNIDINLIETDYRNTFTKLYFKGGIKWKF